MRKNKAPGFNGGLTFLVILALSCSFRLLLTLYAGLLVMLTLTDLLLDTSLSAASLEAAKSAVK